MRDLSPETLKKRFEARVLKRFLAWWTPRSSKQGDEFYGCQYSWGALEGYKKGYQDGLNAQKLVRDHFKK